MPRKILRLPIVLDRTGLSRSTVYQRVTEGKFPRPVSLGARAVGWIETEVEEWIAGQIEASRGTLRPESWSESFVGEMTSGAGFEIGPHPGLDCSASLVLCRPN
jgi:prophage regulatory protein